MSFRGRIINNPIKLYWAGWETDTLSLHREGWQISAEQDLMRNTMRIAINHPKAEIKGMTEVNDFDYRRILDMGLSGPVLHTVLSFSTLGKNVFVRGVGVSNNFDFHAIDPRPKYVEEEIRELKDFANFETVFEVPKHEVYLHEANLQQILDVALQKQEPEQERIRQEMLRNEELKQYRRGKLHTELRLVA